MYIISKVHYNIINLELKKRSKHNMSPVVLIIRILPAMCAHCTHTLLELQWCGK